DPDLAWAEFKTRISQKKNNSAPVHLITRRRYWLNIAAVFAIAVMGWLFYNLYQMYSYDILEAGKIVRHEVLPDGSGITLNKNTVISYKKGLKGETRLVKLESGEAFFDIIPDSSRPFIIEADAITVKVLGTSFNVKHI